MFRPFPTCPHLFRTSAEEVRNSQTRAPAAESGLVPHLRTRLACRRAWARARARTHEDLGTDGQDGKEQPGGGGNR